MKGRYEKFPVADLRRACAKYGGTVENLSHEGVGEYECFAPTSRRWKAAQAHSIMVVWEHPSERSSTLADAIERIEQGVEICPGCPGCEN